jgi:hypothetical protein
MKILCICWLKLQKMNYNARNENKKIVNAQQAKLIYHLGEFIAFKNIIVNLRQLCALVG